MQRLGPIICSIVLCAGAIPCGTFAQDSLRQADQLLNRIYQQRMMLSPPGERKQLLHAQRAWVAFKEKNDEALRGLVAAGAITAATRQEVLLTELNSRKAEIVITFGRPNAHSQDWLNADRDLNETYQACLRTFPFSEQEKFREAQRLWISFRDASAGAAALVTSHRAAELRQLTEARGIATQSGAIPAAPPPEKPSNVDPNTPDPFATGR